MEKPSPKTGSTKQHEQRNFGKRDDTTLDCFSSKGSSSSVQDFDHHSTLERMDSINRELDGLHEKLLRMSVRGLMLEVDLAVQYNPETFLELRQVDIKCQECMKVTENIGAKIEKLTQEKDEMIHKEFNDKFQFDE